MSAESLSLIAGTVLSLAFSYVPGLHERFEPLEATKKRLILLLLLIASAGGAFGLACSGWGSEWGIGISCDRAGVAGLIETAILAIVANQGVYALTPRRPQFPGEHPEWSTLSGEHSERSSLSGEHSERSSLSGEHSERSSLSGEHSERSSLSGEHSERSGAQCLLLSRTKNA